MKKKTKYPLLLSIILGSVMTIYFNARYNNGISNNKSVKKKSSSNTSSRKKSITQTDTPLSYNADIRLVLRNNLRSFTQNIMHAYLPETIEWPKRDIIKKTIDRSFLRNIFFRGWCYEGQSKRLFLDNLKLNFPSEDRYEIKFLDNNSIYLKIDYQTTPPLTGKIKYQLKISSKKKNFLKIL